MHFSFRQLSALVLLSFLSAHSVNASDESKSNTDKPEQECYYKQLDHKPLCRLVVYMVVKDGLIMGSVKDPILTVTNRTRCNTRLTRISAGTQGLLSYKVGKETLQPLDQNGRFIGIKCSEDGRFISIRSVPLNSLSSTQDSDTRSLAATAGIYYERVPKKKTEKTD